MQNAIKTKVENETCYNKQNSSIQFWENYVNMSSSSTSRSFQIRDIFRLFKENGEISKARSMQNCLRGLVPPNSRIMLTRELRPPQKSALIATSERAHALCPRMALLLRSAGCQKGFASIRTHRVGWCLKLAFCVRLIILILRILINSRIVRFLIQKSLFS